MMFTQRSIINRDNNQEQGRELNRTPFRQRTSVFGGLALADLHYLALSTDLVRCHL